MYICNVTDLQFITRRNGLQTVGTIKILCYSYLNDSTGSIFAALYAGKNPANTPNTSDTNRASTITHKGIAVGSTNAFINRLMGNEISKPITPPIMHIVQDSIKN